MPDLEQLGRYRIEAYLGSGAYAGVYRARDAVLQRVVALKILKPALLADDEALNRFQQEARVMAGLLHPHIAWVWDVGQAEDRFFIALRYIAGPSLGKLLIDQGALRWTEALNYTEQIAAALSYAHRKDFVHRDVKPQNIIVSPEDGAILTDFGLVRAMETSGLSTRSGAILGTPQYIAPEVWLGEKATPATDQYALACVLVEMLTGRALFAASTPPAVMRNHFEPVTFSLPWPPDMPREVEPVLRKALAKEAPERYAQITEFVRELRQAAEAPQRLAEQQRLAERRAAALAEAEQKLAEQDWLGLVTIISQLLADDPQEAAALELETHLQQDLRSEATARAQQRQAAEAAALAIRLQREAEEQARREAEEQTKREALERERQAAEAAALAARLQREAEEQARREAEEQTKREALERARQSAEAAALAARLQREAEEQARREAEEQTKREALEQERQAAAAAALAARLQREAEEKARREAEEQAKREALEQERQAAEVAALALHQQREAEEQTRRQLEDQARRAKPALTPVVQSDTATAPAQIQPAPKSHGAKRGMVIGALALLAAAVIIVLMAMQPGSVSVSPSPEPISAVALPVTAATTALPVEEVGSITPTSTFTRLETSIPASTATPVPTATPTATATGTRTPTVTPTRTATVKPSAPPTKIATQLPQPAISPTLKPTSAAIASGPPRITGRVMWGATPLSNIRIVVAREWSDTAPALAETTTDSNGRFTLTDLSTVTGDAWLFIASSPDFSSTGGRALRLPLTAPLDAGTLSVLKAMQGINPNYYDSTAISPTPTLQWQLFPGATQYRVTVYTDGSGVRAFRQNTADTSLIVTTPLTPGKRYNWEVVALAGNAEIASGWGHFNVQ